jgi:hypothetical protein
VTGTELQAAIVELARFYGWRVALFRPARTAHGWRTAVGADGTGYPDLTLVRERVVFAEVKGSGDRLRPEQRDWLDSLREARAEAYVWGPDDWMSGRVDETLVLPIRQVRDPEQSREATR